jgi:hypothetical protein
VTTHEEHQKKQRKRRERARKERKKARKEARKEKALKTAFRFDPTRRPDETFEEWKKRKSTKPARRGEVRYFRAGVPVAKAQLQLAGYLQSCVCRHDRNQHAGFREGDLASGAGPCSECDCLAYRRAGPALNNPGDEMHAMNPYRRKRPKSAADQYLEYEEYEEEESGPGFAMSQISAYELNPRHHRIPCARCGMVNCPCGCEGDPSYCSCRRRANPPIGRGPRQRVFGAGGGYSDSRGRFHPGGGRYLDPNYLPADYPDGTYHPGGGWVSHGYHPGSGYYSNPPCARCGMVDCGCGCAGDSRRCTCRVARNPGRGPRQREWGAGGGHYDRSGWHAGGGRYVDPGYLPSDYPEDTYHAGGGHVIGRGHRKAFWPGSGYSSNPPGGSMLDYDDFESPYSSNPYGGSMLDYDEFQSPYSSNPYLRRSRAPRDPYAVPAYNNPAPYLPAAYGYGHIPYAARVAPGLVTLANPHHYCPNCGYER